MPFTKHIIEPINVSQCPLPVGEPNELECLSNLTLANVIRQLSSLGHHAGRIFDELTKDAVQLNTRTFQMNQRLEKLKVKISQLDIQSEEVTLADFQTKKQFKSSNKIDQQVVSRKTMPEAMRIMYNNADPPPALDKLNTFRKDGKDCMKFYTDPEFFFNIWCNELIKDNETRKVEKKRRKTKAVGGDKSQANPNISHPILNNQQQSVSAQLTNEEAFFYQQQQMAKSNGLNLQYYQQPLMVLLSTGLKQQKQVYVTNDFDDQSLPLPPMTQMINAAGLNNYEIYSKTSQGVNGSVTQIQIQQNVMQQQRMNNMAQMNATQQNNNQKIYSSERPMLPPPPIPAQNHLSDLQQIQQQMIRKKNSDYTNGHSNNIENGHNLHENNNNGNSNDLPPPPSPPHMDIHLMNINNSNYNQQQSSLSQNFMKMNLSIDNSKDEAFDMPLPPPPPPLDLTDSYMSNLPPPLPESHVPQNGNNLPPPPPLPPLVESDTVSTASSASINNNMPSHQTKSADTSKNDDTNVAKNSYLDDINQRRFQLKSSRRDANGSNGNSSILSDSKDNGETIQPFVNNSDVAAIIDFIRKFRPHVRDSSEEDEENSDWDE